MLDYSLFNDLDIRIGTIISANKFPEARNPSYKLKINFGKYGILKSSAQITKLYKPEDLINLQEKNKMKLKKIDGVKFDLIRDFWSLSNDKSVNYIAQFIKD